MSEGRTAEFITVDGSYSISGDIGLFIPYQNKTTIITFKAYDRVTSQEIEISI